MGRKYRSTNNSSYTFKQLVSYLLISVLIVVGLIYFLRDELSDYIPSFASSTNELKAFPEAEGFGKHAVGGRGGKVYEVTNLSDRGPGSLRECVEATGSRICIFKVAGTIVLESMLEINNPYITIAGQSAPGDGITLKSSSSTQPNHLHIRTYEVIIRHLRSRPGTTILNGRALSVNAGSKAADQEQAHNIVIDHSSFSWSGDELIIAWGKTHDVSFQWNIFAESLPSTEDSTGLKGPNLGNDGGGNYSFHHNVVAHHTQRSPQVSGSGGITDIVNNVIYNPGGLGSVVKNGARANYVANYIKSGPETRAKAYIDNSLSEDSINSDIRGIYYKDNHLEGSITNLITNNNQVKNTPFEVPAVTTTSPVVAYQEVLANSGANAGLNCDGTWFERRDAVDERILDSIRNGRSSHNDPSRPNGYITNPLPANAWPVLNQGVACEDSDRDGMADEWEEKYFNNVLTAAKSPNVSAPNDTATDADGDGYTDLEEFLNGTHPKIKDTGTSNPPTPTPTATPSVEPTNKPGVTVTVTPTKEPTSTPRPTATRVPSPTPTKTGTQTQQKEKSTRFYTLEDTYVKKNASNRNFGKSKKIEVDSNIDGYLKFNLEQLEGKTIKSAFLRFNVANSSRNEYQVRLSHNTGWDEDSITYKSRLVGTGTTVKFKPDKKDWMRVNITDLVNKKKGGRMSLVIQATSGDGLSFYSKETEKTPPSLVVEYYE